MITFLKELNRKEILNEGCLFEGTHYDKEAAKILSEVCDIETAEKIIDSLIKEDWVSIFTHTSWIYKFLKPVARIYVEEVKKGKSLSNVIQNTIDLLRQFLIFVKDNKESKDKLYNFFDKAHIDDVEKFMNDYQEELEKQEASQPKPEYSSNEYDVIKIDSYKQLHQMFGGRLTGDGKSAKAADNTIGNGNTAWCHANSKNSWDVHTQNGKYLFFVAAKRGWKEIPPEKTEGNPLDKYGLSLIAIVTLKNGKLLETTLRWNHVGVPNADYVFQTWEQLNATCGQDIKKECEKYFYNEADIVPFIVKDGVFERNRAVDKEYYEEFHGEEISIPEGTKIIGTGAFIDLHSLRKVNIPNGVTKISDMAFQGCNSLTSVTIPDSVTSIEWYAFAGCRSLASINIPDSVTSIGNSAFFDCRSLTSISIPDSVTRIGNGAFSSCNHLTSISIPDSLTNIGAYAFHECLNLSTIKCNNPEIVELIKSQIR